MHNVVTQGVRGYDALAVEDFFAAVEQERFRIERELDVARARLTRARASVMARRVLTSMLDAAVEEVTAKRRQAEIATARLAAIPPSEELAGLPTSPREAVSGSIRWQAIPGTDALLTTGGAR